MSLRLRLTLMQFVQFFILGSWLLTIGAYWFQNKQWSGAEFGAVFSTMGLSSIFMPTLLGIIADRWMNTERLYALCHLCAGAVFFYVPQVSTPESMFWIMLLAMAFYMPTLALSFSVSYVTMEKAKLDIIKDFPPIRVWGTIGFIVALWVISLSGLETSAGQFYVASVASFFLAIFSVVALPACPPERRNKGGSLISVLGLDAFALFKDRKIATFFVFSLFLGAALQLANAYGDTFLHDFGSIEAYKDMFAVKYPAIIMSISQASETLFILTIPFFLKRFGIKQVMFLSMVAWVLRFGLFAYGNPAGGLWMIILSHIVYGMAFDFFNISGSLFVETQAPAYMRASAQGLFQMVTNGFGAYLGSTVSGQVIEKFFTTNGARDWHGIWLTFAIYSLVVAVLFMIFFQHKHNPDEVGNVAH